MKLPARRQWEAIRCATCANAFLRTFVRMLRVRAGSRAQGERSQDARVVARHEVRVQGGHRRLDAIGARRVVADVGLRHGLVVEVAVDPARVQEDGRGRGDDHLHSTFISTNRLQEEEDDAGDAVHGVEEALGIEGGAAAQLVDGETGLEPSEEEDWSARLVVDVRHEVGLLEGSRVALVEVVHPRKLTAPGMYLPIRQAEVQLGGWIANLQTCVEVCDRGT